MGQSTMHDVQTDTEAPIELELWRKLAFWGWGDVFAIGVAAFDAGIGANRGSDVRTSTSSYCDEAQYDEVAS